MALNQVGAGDGAEWLDARDILKTELTCLADIWIQCVRERDMSRKISMYNHVFCA